MVFSADPTSAPPSRLPRWLRSGFWSVADQGLFSVTNLVVSILLARSVSKDEYGAFAVAFTVFLLLGVFHNAFLTQPMLVYGPDQFRTREKSYLGSLLLGHIALTFLGALVLGGIAMICSVVESRHLGWIMFSVAVASPCMLLLWLMRRVGYLRLTPSRAAEGGLVYLLFVCAAMFPLHAIEKLSGAMSFAVMGAGSLVAGCWLVYRERIGIPEGRFRNPIFGEAVAQHRQFGRWAAAAGFVNFVPQHLSYQIVGLMQGLGATAELRAVYNLVQPVLLANVALCVILVPTLVRQRGTPKFARTVNLSIVALVGFSAVYWIGMGLFHGPIMHTAYNGRYGDDGLLIWIMCAQPAFTALFGVYNSVLESHQRPDRVFYSGLAAAIVSVVLAVVLTHFYGLRGTAIGTLIAFVINAVLSIWFAAGLMRRTAIYTGSQMQPTEFDLAARPTDAPIPPLPANPVKPLFIAFACEPGPGSEPAVGWNTVYAASRLYPVWVITHPLHQQNLDAWLQRNDWDRIHPFYYTLPSWMDWMWNTHFTLNIYYYLWQWRVTHVARRLHNTEQFEIAHHVTYVRYWMPSAASKLGIPYIFGPVGGGEGAPMRFYRTLGLGGWLTEVFRAAIRKFFEYDPRTRQTIRDASVVIACSEETAAPLRKLGATDVRVASSIGNLAPADLPPKASASGEFTFISVGRLLHWKAFHFGLEAFSKADLPNAQYIIAGDGPARARLERLADQLGVSSRVRFTGEVSRSQILELIRDADVLVHPSLHDSGGMVVLEAMDLAKPSIVLNLGGPAVHLDETCGVRIDAISPEQVVTDLAAAMKRLHADPEIVIGLGAAGKRRVAEKFGWGTKAVWYDQLYREALSLRQTAVPTRGWAARQTAEANINA